MRVNLPSALFILIASSILLGGCVPFTVTEWSFLSTNPSKWESGPSSADSRFNEVAVKHADGNVSHGVSLSLTQPSATVLFFLGNGEVVDREGATRLWQFHKLGVNAYVFDRRGYGRTSGKPFINTLASDALEIFDEVRQRTCGPLIVHGFSLGSMLAGHVTANRPVDALVLEGSAPNISEYVSVHLPWYMKLILRVKISPELQQVNNGQVVEKYKGPLLIVAGENDEDTVAPLSKRLFDMATSSNKRLEIIPKVDHYALITPTGFEVYRSFIGTVTTTHQTAAD